MKATVTKITTTNGEFYVECAVDQVISDLRFGSQWFEFPELVERSVPHSMGHNVFVTKHFERGNKRAINTSLIVSVCELGERDVETEDEDDD